MIPKKVVEHLRELIAAGRSSEIFHRTVLAADEVEKWLENQPSLSRMGGQMIPEYVLQRLKRCLLKLEEELPNGDPILDDAAYLLGFFDEVVPASHRNGEEKPPTELGDYYVIQGEGEEAAYLIFSIVLSSKNGEKVVMFMGRSGTYPLFFLPSGRYYGPITKPEEVSLAR